MASEQLRVIADELTGPRRMIVNRAADALDASDRDVAELVAALGTMLNDTQSVADMAYVKAVYAKHKGGAHG